jgi:hypothetical protein
MGKIEIPWACGYFVYEDGRVQSPSGKFLKAQVIDSRGYMRVWPACKPVRLHRLVAELFVPNPLGLPEVNHLDGDKQNNAAGNLAWSSRKQNMRHASDSGLTKFPSGEKARAAKLNDAQVAEILSAYKPRQKGHTMSAIAARFGISEDWVSKLIKGTHRVLP